MNPLIQNIIQACGGECWRRPKTLQLSGSAVFTPYGKPENRLDLDTYKMFRVFPEENNAAHKANGKVRFDALYDENVFFQLTFDGQKSKMELGEIAKPYATHFQWSNNFGFGILRFSDQEGVRVEELVEDQVEGKPARFLKIIDREKHETFFAVDKETCLPRMLGFSSSVGYHHRIYADYKKAPDGFMVPTKMTVYFEGIKWMAVDWQDFKTNEPIDNSVFKI